MTAAFIQTLNTLNNRIIFLSDLHISLEKSEIIRRFSSFLNHQAKQANSVYILGDLFDAWIGDDDNTPPNKTLKQQLKRATDAGIRIYLQQGNRDFLLGKRFCEETGVTLLGDFEVIDLNGVRTLLTHGDLLCTDDLPYQTFRAKSRTQEWQQNVLSKPLLIRLFVARWYRFRSHFHKRKKTQEIMDVNQQTVINVMKKHDCLRLIHGHTHRPAIHTFEIDKYPAQRFVLSDWKKDSAEILCWDSEGYHIEKIS